MSDLRDGELLLCIGGPLDGKYRSVTVLNWGGRAAPSSGFKMSDGTKYRRDGRQWIYAGVVKENQ